MKRLALLLLAALSFQLSAFSQPAPFNYPPASAGGGTTITNLGNGSNTLLGTNLFVYSTGTTNPPLRVIGGVQTNSNPVTISTTYNAAGVSFDGLKIEITNTASAATSRLLDVSSAGTTARVYVRSDGALALKESTSSGPTFFLNDSAGEGYGLSVNTDGYGMAFVVRGTAATGPDLGGGMGVGNIYVGSEGRVGWGQNMSIGQEPGASTDTYIFRDAAGTLAQRNGAANPQTNRLYHTYSNTSNGQWLEMRTSTNSVTIAAMTQGTGADDLNVTVLPAGTGGFVIGATGTPVKAYWSQTATLNFGSIATLSSADLTITVTGAAANDTVTLGPPTANNAGVGFYVFVSAADTVTVRCFNFTALSVDPDSATYRVGVTQH